MLVFEHLIDQHECPTVEAPPLEVPITLIRKFTLRLIRLRTFAITRSRREIVHLKTPDFATRVR